MLELQRNAHCVAFQKDLEEGYHWNDPRRHLHAYSRREVVCETCFQVNNQGIGSDSLFINSDLRSIYYITKKNIVYAFYIDVNIRQF